MLLKNRKNIENHHCGGGPKAKTGPRPARRAPPPRQGRSVGMGRKIGPRSAHSWAECGPTGGDRSWPSDLIQRPAASLAGSNPGRRPPPETLEHFHSPLSLSTQNSGGHGDDGHGDRGGGVAGAAIDPLASPRGGSGWLLPGERHYLSFVLCGLAIPLCFSILSVL